MKKILSLLNFSAFLFLNYVFANACPALYAPVEVNGIWYSNECMAKFAEKKEKSELPPLSDNDQNLLTHLKQEVPSHHQHFLSKLLTEWQTKHSDATEYFDATQQLIKRVEDAIFSLTLQHPADKALPKKIAEEYQVFKLFELELRASISKKQRSPQDRKTIILETCTTFHDGCNTCHKGKDGIVACTLKYCLNYNKPYCLDQKKAEEIYDQNSRKNMIPLSCKTFNDGCNTCNRMKNENQAACTRKMCFNYQKPFCLGQTSK